MLISQVNWTRIQITGIPSFRFNFLDLGSVIAFSYRYIFPAAGILVLIYLLYAGIELMTSAGDPKKIQSAKDKITGAVVGFVIIFAAFWIVQLVSFFLGVGALRGSF